MVTSSTTALLSLTISLIIHLSSQEETSTSDPLNGWEEPKPEPEDDWIPDNISSSEDQYVTEVVATKRRIAVIGVPLEYGQERDGVQNGPDWLRRELYKKMDEAGCFYDDYGDTEVEASDSLDDMDERNDCGKAKFAYTDAMAVAAVVDAVSQILSEDSRKMLRVEGPSGVERPPAFPLTLGGDHSLAMGTLEATGKRYSDLAVIYIDAHGDINTIKSTVTGHIHGMPLSFVIKDKQFQEENADCPAFSFITPVINPSNIAFIGSRDLDPPEVEFLDRLNISRYTPSMVNELGPQEVVKQIFDRINPDRTRPVHVSFDIDSIDPLYAPSTGTAVPNGLTLTEMIEISKEIARTRTLVALDVVEVNPKIKRNRAKLTVRTAVEVVMGFVSEMCT